MNHIRRSCKTISDYNLELFPDLRIYIFDGDPQLDDGSMNRRLIDQSTFSKSLIQDLLYKNSQLVALQIHSVSGFKQRGMIGGLINTCKLLI